jgi:hypothetical protein
MNKEDHNRLVEIQEEMLKLLDEAKRIMIREGGISYERAKDYWLASIETALTNEHNYLGGSMFTMEDAIAENRPW